MPTRFMRHVGISVAVTIVVGGSFYGALRYKAEPRGIGVLETISRTAQVLVTPLLHFEPNQGQADESVKFLVRGRGYTLFLTGSEAVLALRKDQHTTDRVQHSGKAEETAVVRMQLVEANPNPTVTGQEELPGKVNYFIGNDPAKWRTNLPTYGKVKYEDVYPNIALLYYGASGELEYDFIVKPGASPQAITLGFEGADQLSLDAQGNLALQLDAGVLSFKKPVVYQELDGQKRFIQGRYVRKGSNRIGFELAQYDRTKTLVIDPTLLYSTYLGGNGSDPGADTVVDAAGNVYVTGVTGSLNFPTTPGSFQTSLSGGSDAFVTKLNSTGSTLVHSTYLGGTGYDQAYGMTVDPAGNTYVTGQTTSADFPTTAGTIQSAFAGGFYDAFVTKLSPTGSSLVYSTYLGGAADDFGYAVAVDATGNAHVTGQTGSTNFPVMNAFQTTYGGGSRDAFLTKINPAGSSLVHSTYLGGFNLDSGNDVAFDPMASAYVTGSTQSPNFPVTPGAFDTTCGTTGTCNFNGINYFNDAFVTKFSAGGSALVYSTYLGGSDFEAASSIGIDSTGNAYVAGYTYSQNFPTMNAFQPTFGGGVVDAFVTKLNPTGSALVYSSYLGGSGIDETRFCNNNIDASLSGNAYVTGWTTSLNFPTANPFQPTHGGGNWDAFVTRVSPSGSALVYSSYLGGTGTDQGCAIKARPSGYAYTTGYTRSANFPITSGAFQQAFGGGFSDAFVTWFDPLPLGVARYGASTPACLGAITMNVTDTPKAGNQNFAVTVANAPPNTSGVLLIGAGQSVTGIPIAGIILYVDLAQPLYVVQSVTSDAWGYTQVPIPIPTGAAGIQAFSQVAWLNTVACGGSGTLSASDALALTIQP